MRSCLVALFLCLNLSSCAWRSKPDVPLVVPERLPLEMSNPDPLQLRDVHFVVITPENAAAIFATLKDPVIMGLSGADYKAMAENLLLIQHHLILQQKVTDAYRDYYERNLLPK